MKHTWLERVLIIVVVAIALAYLIYTLAWQKEEFNYLHFLTFLVVAVLALVPFASRLRIPNVIEFDRKIDSVREETKKELADIRNIISSSIQTQVSPVQHQWNVIAAGDDSLKRLAQALSVAESESSQQQKEIEKIDSKSSEFLREVDHLRYGAYCTFLAARSMQIAMREERAVIPDDLGKDKAGERVISLIDRILHNGVQLFVPPNEQGRTIEELQDMRKLLEIYIQVKHDKAEAPTDEEMQVLISKAKNAIGNILTGVIWHANHSLLYQQSMMKNIEAIKKELGN